MDLRCWNVVCDLIWWNYVYIMNVMHFKTVSKVTNKKQENGMAEQPDNRGWFCLLAPVSQHTGCLDSLLPHHTSTPVGPVDNITTSSFGLTHSSTAPCIFCSAHCPSWTPVYVHICPQNDPWLSLWGPSYFPPPLGVAFSYSSSPPWWQWRACCWPSWLTTALWPSVTHCAIPSSPLCYSVLKYLTICVLMLLASWLRALLIALTHVVYTVPPPFCVAREIHHFFVRSQPYWN